MRFISKHKPFLILITITVSVTAFVLLLFVFKSEHKTNVHQENILKSPYIEVNILLFKDLNAESISNVTATCITSQAEIYPDEMEEFVDLLSHIKIGERVKEKVIDGLSPQYFIIEYKDGTTQRIGMHGGIITIDNQKYYTEYTSCQELSGFYEKIMKRAKTV